MHVVALYKTWDGEEWLEASLSSIYDHVDEIVMVHSELSWLGERGNTCREPAMRWSDENDTQGKVHHVDVECTSQEHQYARGIEYIRQHIPECDVVMAIDTDEVWEEQYLTNAKRQVAAAKFPAYRCDMHSYLKTPFYRVHPPYGQPTVFFRDFDLLTQSPRGCRAEHVDMLEDVWFHHYTYVRKSRADVERKIAQSCKADGGERIAINWLERVYDRLPEGQDLHAFQRWKHVWRQVISIWWSDLPAPVRECEFMKQFWPEGKLLHGEMNALYNLALGRRVAVDLGTYKGLSAIIFSLAADRVVTYDVYERIHQIDSYADETGHNYRKLHNSEGHTLGSVGKTLSQYGNIVAMQDHTAHAAARWNGEAVDFLFVDADHSYDGTVANIKAWWPHIAPHGLIVLHDNNDIHPGVMRVVSELEGSDCVKSVSLGDYSGSLAAFKKVKKHGLYDTHSDLQAASR